MYERAKKILRIGELAVLLRKLSGRQEQLVVQDPTGKMADGLSGFLYREEEGRDRIFPLDAVAKTQFERALGEDLSAVRIHLGPYAAELTHQANAQAVTLGHDIFFAPQTYAPDTEEGMALLAHELQHFIQSKKQKRMVYFEDIAQLESEAERVEEIMAAIRLHNVDQPLDSYSSLPELNPGIGTINRFDPLKKNETGAKSDTLEGFLRRQSQPVYELQLPNGKKYRLSPGERKKLQDMIVAELQHYVAERSQELSESDYEAWLLDFYRFLSQ